MKRMTSLNGESWWYSPAHEATETEIVNGAYALKSVAVEEGHTRVARSEFVPDSESSLSKLLQPTVDNRT